MAADGTCTTPCTTLFVATALFPGDGMTAVVGGVDRLTTCGCGVDRLTTFWCCGCGLVSMGGRVLASWSRSWAASVSSFVRLGYTPAKDSTFLY